MTDYTDKYSDNPGLNFDSYAYELSKVAIQASLGSSGAFTVGIFGSWGSGKTTLMRCIERNLKDSIVLETISKEVCQEGRNKTIKTKTIWFNPWKYDDISNVRTALIQTILDEIIMSGTGNIAQANQLSHQYEYAKCLMKMGEHIVGAVVQSQIVVNPIEIGKTIYDAYRRRDNINESTNKKDNDENYLDSPYSFINKFEEGFKEVVKSYVGEQGKLIIFIDDLDRCLPENALTILESIKLYLDNSSCIFFIGLDKRVIEQAVTHKYDSKLGISGKEYLEKMIQLNFFLPPNHNDSLIIQMMDELNLLVAPGVHEEYDLNNGIWKMILSATQANMRKTKQFIIAFDLIKNIAKSSKINEDIRSQLKELTFKKKLAKVLLIQLNYPDLYTHSFRNSRILENLQKFVEDKDRDLDDDCIYFTRYGNLMEFLSNTKNVDISNDFKEIAGFLSITGGG